MNTQLDGSERAGVLARLASAPDRLSAAARKLDAADVLSAPPAAGWTARETVGHVCRLETEVLGARLDALETTERPVWRWSELQPTDAPWMVTIETALAEFAGRRSVTLARLAALDEAAWARSGVHETFGPLDVLALLNVFADHDDEHVDAIAARLAARP